MAFVEPVTLSARGVTLLPLSLAHETGLRAAATDGELWKLRVTSVPEPEQTRAFTEIAVTMSTDLKHKGFTFVGPTICYAFMQASGMVNDHLVTCPRHAQSPLAVLPPGTAGFAALRDRLGLVPRHRTDLDARRRYLAGPDARRLEIATETRDRTAIVKIADALRDAAGNFYINDKPTGAVVGQQPFGGARASGTNDKAGSVVNLLRWVSPRAIKETFVPPTDHRYPHQG